MVGHRFEPVMITGRNIRLVVVVVSQDEPCEEVASVSFLFEQLLGPAVALLGWVTVWAIRTGRGRMVVKLDPVTAGKPIDGAATISARRKLGPAALRISLRGEEDWWEMRLQNQVEGPYRVKRTEEIYRYDFNLDSALTVERGGDHTVLIHVPTPDIQTGCTGDGRAKRSIERTEPRSPRRASDRPNRQRWTLTVVYDLRGPAFETVIELPLTYDLDRLDAGPRSG